MLFSTRHQVQRMNAHTRNTVPLVRGLRNAIALDYYYNHEQEGEQSLVFWTDVVDDKIYSGTLISNSEEFISIHYNFTTLFDKFSLLRIFYVFH